MLRRLCITKDWKFSQKPHYFFLMFNESPSSYASKTNCVSTSMETGGMVIYLKTYPLKESNVACFAIYQSFNFLCFEAYEKYDTFGNFELNIIILCVRV